MEILNLRAHSELFGMAAEWFHEKWGIPAASYLESMKECRKGGAAVPQWYAAMEDGQMVGGLGVIENDFHSRKDLAPNVCALYVEEAYRRRGIAGELLQWVCSDMGRFGIDTLYLVTEHTSFYERYGWRFLGLARDTDGSDGWMRIYAHTTEAGDKL
ncbi:GNAT family N-acetyltransferase [Pseudoflavonifractor capillosus]|uniref:GNAT family N-acetyltransferase n=1 Tax=Pseudoflavonifractor capillosus TaxID=106588 RepID=A0A921MNQ5_9FIRM|nr:GNAT family N-acetyltransferase [Pseudoflavonifractor capillosus]HJG87199.1 GNAT family N-acetyltransferase [Pseudoflavonifractor capillosus]